MQNIMIGFTDDAEIMKICDSFWATSKINPSSDAKEMFKFLISPDSVYKMMMASDFGLPALTFVAKDLENQFKNCSDAPLHHRGQYQNAVHRQNIGRMIKYIMEKFGYIPIDGKLSERARLPKFSESECFSTSAVYAKRKS